MFSVVFVNQSVILSTRGVGFHVTVIHDALDPNHTKTPTLDMLKLVQLDLPVQGHLPQPWTHFYRNPQPHIQGPPDMSKLIHYEACTVGKRVISHLSGNGIDEIIMISQSYFPCGRRTYIIRL